MDEYLECKLEQVLLLKCLYDLGRLKAMWETIGNLLEKEVFSEDLYFELGWYSQGPMFDSFDETFNEDYETTLCYIQDGIIDRYFRLCLEYERKKGILPLQDPFFIEGDQFLYDVIGGLDSQDHAYAVQYTNTADSSCQIIYEFRDGYDTDTAVAFAEYLLYLRDGAKPIQAAIDELDRRKVLPFPSVRERKEAA